MDYISKIRQYVGHMPIMATAVLGIIYDKKRGILFEKRSDNGMWCVPSGSIELEESLEQALKREVKEETSLEISNIQFFDVKSGVHAIYPNGDEVYYTNVCYIVNTFSGNIENNEESIELKWFDINQIPKDIVPTQIEYIEKFVNSKNEQ